MILSCCDLLGGSVVRVLTINLAVGGAGTSAKVLDTAIIIEVIAAGL